MDLRDIYQKTTWPEVPTIINYNNDEIERAFNYIYDASKGIIVPVTTTGRVKGGWGEFVNLVTDNLTVRNQYTNLYDNNTTADYNWYRMLVDSAAALRDPCTALTNWPFENYLGYKILDVNKPYYKITNGSPIILNNPNVSQVVGIYFDASLIGVAPFEILLDPCAGITYTVDTSYAGSAYIEFVNTSYDPSWGSSWEQYKYAIEGAGGIESTISIAGFIKEASLGSDLYWLAGLLEVSTSVAGISQAYVDGSLAAIKSEYIPDSSLSSDFVWSGGSLAINTTLTGVSQDYVDGSLAARDVSMQNLDARLELVEVSINYVTDISTILFDLQYISDSSLSSDFYWDSSGLLEVSTNFGGPTFEYVDGSLAKYLLNASLGSDFYWDAGLLEVSLNLISPSFAYVDGSLNVKANDASLALYVLKAGDTMTGDLVISSDDIITDIMPGNTRLGSNTLLVNAAGNYNTAIGWSSLLSNTTGSYNTTLGWFTLGENTAGYDNIAIGYEAGTYVLDVTTGNIDGKGCIFIGARTAASAQNSENEIVIGTDAQGMGSNTVVLGNENCASTYLRGALYVVKDVTLGGLSPKTTETDIVYYNTNTGELTYSEQIDASVLTSSSSFIYMGNESVDGSWRFRIDSSGNLSVEKRISGSWEVRGNFI